MRLLIIEPDTALGSFFVDSLVAEGHECVLAVTLAEVHEALAAKSCDLAIIEADAGETNGAEYVASIRAASPEIILLALTSSQTVENHVALLDAGADDCITKPFSFVELSAKIRAAARRRRSGDDRVLRLGDLVVDRLRRTAERNGRHIELTPKEFALLEFLMIRAGGAVSRSSIIENVWKDELENATNIVDVYINYLRKKIDQGSHTKLIHTIRGVGYQLEYDRNAEREADVLIGAH